MKFIELAAKIAWNASCEISKCGSVIVENGKVIGGFNSPPADLEFQKRCFNLKKDYNV